MLKKFSGLFAGAACLMALSGTAFAQGAVGNAVGGVVDAGEDIADGIFDAGRDVVRGVTGGRTGDSAADSDIGDLTSPGDGDASGDSGASGDTDTSSGDTTSSDPDTSSDDNAIGDTSGESTSNIEEGGAAGNPGTGDVTMGYAAISTVLAALGVTVTSIRRKQD